MIGLLLLALPITPTPAVDDGPCPAGTYAIEVIIDGRDGVLDYTGSRHGGQWLLDGALIGVSAQEDECVIPMTDDRDHNPVDDGPAWLYEATTLPLTL